MRLVSAASLALLAACASSGGGAKDAKLTESQEYYVGRMVAAQTLHSYPLYDDPALNEYVNLVGLTIAQASNRPELFGGYHFAVIASTEVNAFAAPGGFVFVTTAALREMRNEEELAGVLAHEIAHVNLKHPDLAAQNAAQEAANAEGITLASEIGGALAEAFGAGSEVQDALPYVSRAADTVNEAIHKGYSREQEMDADRMAVDLDCRVGYDPRGLKTFLGRLHSAGGWMSSHPGSAERLAAIDQEIARRGRVPDTLPARTDAFQKATAGLRR